MLKQINQEISDFNSKEITIVPGFTFNQKETIEKIFFYYNSKFKTGEVDEDGDRKYFLNINKNPCKVCSKAIDFDTKNIRLLTTGGGDPTRTWFMERDLKFWMRDKQFGKVLNRIFKEIPIFGSVVLKIVNGTPYFVDLRNFVVEQQAETLDESNYIIEVHNFTPAQFRKIGKDMKWGEDKIQETLDLYYEMKKRPSHIRVLERYGDAYDEETGKWEYKRIFYADVGDDVYNQRGEIEMQKKGVELAADKWEGHPYWEFHMEKMPGRWLGIGVVETLFEPQIRQNELANLQSKASYWASLRLFWSQDPNMAGNLKTEKKNGDVITGDAPITQIDMADRNLAFFNQETQKWMQNRSELTFSYDVVQGERLPAGTPLGSAQIAISQTLSYFEGIQENIALDVKEMLYEVILPQFAKDSNKEHTLRLVGKDLDTYADMIKNEMVFKEVVRLALEKGHFATNSEKDIITVAMEEKIKKDKEVLLTVPKDAYKDVKYDIDIDITGESVDTRVRYATRFAILQAMTADPTMTTDPIKKNFLYGMAEDGGLNPHDLFGANTSKTEEVIESGKGAGGGVSAPMMGGQSMAGEMTNTV